MALEIQPLAAALGAEIRGWDPSEDLSDELVAQIRQALGQHLALVFRGHAQPSDAELVRFARHFGDLIVGTGWFGDDVEFPEILPITNVLNDDGDPAGTGAAIEFPYHADYAYLERVGKESFLNAVELPAKPPPSSRTATRRSRRCRQRRWRSSGACWRTTACRSSWWPRTWRRSTRPRG